MRLTRIPPTQEFFENPAFRPDGLKLYPTLVIRGTGLYELWKTGIVAQPSLVWSYLPFGIPLFATNARLGSDS